LHETLRVQAQKKLDWIAEDQKLTDEYLEEGMTDIEIKKKLKERDDAYESETGRQRCVAWPRKLFLQSDNGAANKNNAFFRYCAWLVHEGIFETVRVSFMMVGHTHDIVDQVFSRISFGLKDKKLLTVQKYVQDLPALYQKMSAKTVTKEQYKAPGNYMKNMRESQDQNVSYALSMHVKIAIGMHMPASFFCVIGITCSV
jgi:hypothetical protein